jgi:hypothetical protein
MQLTPQEQQRIYEEEKVRAEARAQLAEEERQKTLVQAGQQMGKFASNCLIGCAVLIGLLFLFMLMLVGGNQSNDISSQTSATTIGPHDGKTQEQVDKDQQDIRTLYEAARRIQADPSYGK